MPIDITAMLKDWGVTLGFLSVVATALLVVFVISFREFATWFVRVNLVLKNQKEILSRLESLEAFVKAEREIEKQPAKIKTPPIPIVTAPKAETAPDKELFQLHN